MRFFPFALVLLIPFAVGCKNASEPAASIAPMTATAEENTRQRTLLHTADAAKAAGKTEDAIRYYKDAAAIPGGGSRPALELAAIFKSRGESQQAIAVLEHARQVQLPNAEVIEKLAKIYLDSGKDKDALETAATGLQDNPDSVTLLNISGIVHDRRGEHETAQKNYLKALENTKNHQNTLNNLALSYIASVQPQLALDAMQQAQDDMSIRQLRAMAYGISGDESKAREWALKDLSPAQAEENLLFYKKLKNQKIDVAVLFKPSQN